MKSKNLLLIFLLTTFLWSSRAQEQLFMWGVEKPQPRQGRIYTHPKQGDETFGYKGDGVRINTGPTIPRSQLKYSSSLSVDEDDAVIEGLFIGGGLKINAKNVIIRNCIIDGWQTLYVIRTDYSKASNILIEDCEVYNGSSAIIRGGNFTIRRSHLHTSGGDIIKPQDNVVIENCYIEKTGSAEAAHGDGIQWTAGKNALVRWNTFFMPGDDPIFANSQCIIGGTQNGPLTDITITQNWINGGGKSVNIGGGSGPGILVQDNLFGFDFLFGPGGVSGEGNYFTCNRWESTGKDNGVEFSPLDFLPNQTNYSNCQTSQNPSSPSELQIEK